MWHHPSCLLFSQLWTTVTLDPNWHVKHRRTNFTTIDKACIAKERFACYFLIKPKTTKPIRDKRLGLQKRRNFWDLSLVRSQQFVSKQTNFQFSAPLGAFKENRKVAGRLPKTRRIRQMWTRTSLRNVNNFIRLRQNMNKIYFWIAVWKEGNWQKLIEPFIPTEKSLKNDF